MILPLKRLRFEAYRAFPAPHELELRQLNVIFGKNGSGKSSLIHLPQLIERGLQGGAGTLAELLSGETEERALELVHGAAGGSLTIGVDYQTSAGHESSLDFNLRILRGTQRTAQRSSVEIETWSWTGDQSESLTLTAGAWFNMAEQTANSQNYVRSAEYLRPNVFMTLHPQRVVPNTAGARPEHLTKKYGDDVVGTVGLSSPPREESVLWRGLFPNLLESKLPTECYKLLQLRALSLVAMRPTPPRVQSIPLQDVLDFGSDGARVTDLLAADAVFKGGLLLEAVSAWYSEHLGWKLTLQLNAQPTAPNQGSYACLLTNLKSGFQIPLAAHGTGMSQALPVVVRCLAAQQGRLSCSVLAFEEPETNLHPAAHGAMADLFIETAKMQPVPLMVETHSEIFLLRIRRRIAEGTLDPAQVAIFWVDEDPKLGSASVQPLEVDRDGWIEEWPYGIFAEDAEESRAIARARRERAERVGTDVPEDPV